MEGVRWDVTELCRHGMKDPVSKLPYKKSLCLMHNFEEGFLDPVFLRCKKGTKHFHEKHERVEGYCSGYGRRSTLSQVYPFQFCKRLALCFREYLSPSRHPRTDDRQTFLVDDMLSIADMTIDETVNLQEVFHQCMDETSLGFSDSVFTASATQFMSVKVKDPDIAKAMTRIDSLPKTTSLDLSDAKTKREVLVATCARLLRRHYFPNLVYHRCVAVRGTDNSLTSVLTEDDSALVMFWKKHERPRKISFSQGKRWLKERSADFSQFSALIFWNADEKNPKDSPIPSLKGHISMPDDPKISVKTIGTQTSDYGDPD